MANASVWAKPEQEANAAQQFAMQPEPGPTVWAPVGDDTTPNMSAFTAAPPKVQVFSPLQQQIAHDQQRLQKVQFEQANPWGTPQNHPGKLGKLAHAFSMIGNIAGDIFAPSTMALIPGTQLNREVQEGGLAKRLNMEQAEQSENEARGAETAKAQEETKEMPGKTQSEEGLQGAQTGNLESETSERNQNAAMGPALALSYSHAVNEALKAGRDPATDPIVQSLADTITNIQRQPLPKGMEKVDLVGPDGKPMAANYDPMKGVYTDASGKVIPNPRPYEKPNQAGMVTVVAPDPNNPGGGIVERLGTGAHIAPGSQTATQFGSLNTPTTQQRNVAAQASLVHEQMPGLISEIQQNAQLLGPMQGRWNEFMQGKVGMDNPAMAGLRADLLMMSSAVALMHARGRLPENLREEFDNAINAPHQTPQNLVATLQKIDQWTAANMNTMNRPGGETQAAAPPQGADVKVKGADGKMYWGNSKTKQILGVAQ